MRSLALWSWWSALPATIWKHFWAKHRVGCCRGREVGGGASTAAAPAAGMKASPFVWLNQVHRFKRQLCLLQPWPSERIREGSQMPGEPFLVPQCTFHGHSNTQLRPALTSLKVMCCRARRVGWGIKAAPCAFSACSVPGYENELSQAECNNA